MKKLKLFVEGNCAVSNVYFLFAIIVFMIISGFLMQVIAQQITALPNRIYIDDNFSGAGGICIGDMNNDEKLDVIVTGWMANAIVWYEAPGWIQHTIDNDIDTPQNVEIADLDGDNDIDAVAVGWGGEVSWYEAPNWDKHTIDSTLWGAFDVDIADINDDSYPDIIAAGFVADTVVWYEAPSWTEHVIDNLFGANSVYIVDLNDNDTLDIVAAGYGNLVWYETLTWEKNIIDSGEIGFGGISVGDLNNDGKLDVVSRDSDSGHVFWYEAPDWDKHIIDENLEMARHTCVADMDGDEDLDVIACGWWGEVAWYKAPNWDKIRIDTSLTGSAGLCVADINADSIFDIISTGVIINSVVWYNLTTGIDIAESQIPFNYVLRQNYPNPLNPSTTIEFTLPKSEFVKLKVYNILGKEVSTLVSNKLNQGNHTYTFDGKNLASGIYYYQIVAGEYREVKKMILLR